MPHVIDLYAGVGGLSLGAARAGFELAAAVENDDNALDTHSRNFPQTIHLDADVSTLNGDELLEAAELEDAPDGLIGGPPCQGFSHMGHKREDDHRNEQFIEFFRMVGEVGPKFYLGEDVPGILDPRFDDIRERAINIVAGDYEI